METPCLVKKDQTLSKIKDSAVLKKTVWEYNSGQFEKADIAKSIVSGRYPEKGWAANDVCTMFYYLLSGTAVVTLESGERFSMESEDVFLLPSKTWYSIEGEFEALMVCAPAWYKEQSLSK